MRLRRNQLKNLTLKRYQSRKDEEGNVIPSFSSEGIQIQAEIWPASGQIQAELYGQRLGYMLNMLYQGDIKIKELDGICIDVDQTENPDYRVISIKTFTEHQLMELEKI